MVGRLVEGLQGSKNGNMLSVTGPYGSGKSTMAIFLKGLLAPNRSAEWSTASKILHSQPQYYESLIHARQKAGIHNGGAIRCCIMARKEPVSITILRGLAAGITEYFGDIKKFPASNLIYKYIKKDKIPDTEDIIKIIKAAATVAPTLIMIDEFGKNIEYFATDETQQSDLFLLQELAEGFRMEKKIPLHIITLQHMAFEEYAVGASTSQKKEWAKIQGRFEDIPFANSPEQTRHLISNTIQLTKNEIYRKSVARWARQQHKMIRDIGIGIEFTSEMIASCYPLNPLSLEVIPELCSRYGQRERTMLSFLSDSKKYTVATFIDEHSWSSKSPPTVNLDMLYDFFISGTGMIHSSSQNISRLMEIETIIRDVHGLNDIEKKTLKTIGMLNLISRTGHLRASKRMIEYAIGINPIHILETLEKRSIITYREHADEYRIWHGTDIDIAAKLDTYRSRYQGVPIIPLLQKAIKLEPIVAAKHGIRTGTMRIFDRRFESYNDTVGNFDGIILYCTDENISECEKPTITVIAPDTTELRIAAIEVIAMRDILESEKDLTSDWVARTELSERLADAEAGLDMEFGNAYGVSARWSHYTNGKYERLEGTPSSMVSQVCDKVYDKSPTFYNEMINRTNLSAQGSTAKKALLEAMILHPDKSKFGITGNGPDRAIYEAVFFQNHIHKMDKSLGWTLYTPRNSKVTPVWKKMLDVVKKSKGRITVSKIYDIVKAPPFGVRDGPLQLVFLAMIMVNRDNIALYEHGTFVPKLRPDIAERMTKNPEHFEVKYFRQTAARRALLEKVARDLDVTTGTSLLDVVGHLVRLVSVLPPHIKSTKKFDENTISVRNSILDAREPDTLLFESLPTALKCKSDMNKKEIAKFSKNLVKSASNLQNGMQNMFDEIKNMLYKYTGVTDRVNLSKAAKAIERGVTDHKTKVFLGAISADTLEKEENWLNYIAMSLTDVPPADWKDDQREMFSNELQIMAIKFKRLAGIYFAGMSNSMRRTSFHVAITRADGTERHDIVTPDPEKSEVNKEIIAQLKRVAKQKGLTKSDLLNIIAILDE